MSAPDPSDVPWRTYVAGADYRRRMVTAVLVVSVPGLVVVVVGVPLIVGALAVVHVVPVVTVGFAVLLGVGMFVVLVRRQAVRSARLVPVGSVLAARVSAGTLQLRLPYSADDVPFARVRDVREVRGRMVAVRLRSGAWLPLPAELFAPGDVERLRAGARAAGGPAGPSSPWVGMPPDGEPGWWRWTVPPDLPARIRRATVHLAAPMLGLVGLVGVLLVVEGVLVASAGDWASVALIGLALLALAAMCVATTVVGLRRSARSMPVGSVMAARITDDHLELSSRNGRSVVRWAALARTRRVAGGMLGLRVVGSRRWVLIPVEMLGPDAVAWVEGRVAAERRPAG